MKAIRDCGAFSFPAAAPMRSLRAWRPSKNATTVRNHANPDRGYAVPYLVACCLREKEAESGDDEP